MVFIPITIGDGDGGGGAGAAQVANLAELKQIIPTAGAIVYCAGRATAGDGGEGWWTYSNNAEYIDDCTCVCADSDLSAEQTAAQTSGAINSVIHADLVPGTVSVTFSNGLVIPDAYWHKHGSQWAVNVGTPTADPVINYKTGHVKDNGAFEVYRATVGDGFALKYKYAVQPRRWVRVHDGMTFHMHWLGVPSGDNDQNTLCWGLNHARRLGFRRVALGNATWRFRTTIEYGGMTLCYGESASNGTRSVLKVTDFDPLYSYRTGFSWAVLTPLSGGATSEQHLGVIRTAIMSLMHNTACVKQETNASFIALEDIEIDGNCTASSPFITTPGNYTGVTIDTFQDVMRWGGVCVSEEDTRVVPTDCEFHATNLFVHGTLSAGILVSANVKCCWEKIRAQDSGRNHAMYGFSGYCNGLDIRGYAHGGMAYGYWGEIHNFNCSEFVPNPIVPGTGPTAIMAIRGKNVFTSATPHPDWRGLTIRKGHWDMNGTASGGPGNCIGGIDDHITIEDVVIVGSQYRGTSIFHPNYNPDFTIVVARQCTLKNILALRRGNEISLHGDASQHWIADGLDVDGLQIKEYSSAFTTPPAVFQTSLLGYVSSILEDADPGLDPAYTEGYQLRTYRNIVARDPIAGSLFNVNVRDAGGLKTHTLLDRCHVNCASPTIFIVPGVGTGRYNAMTVDDHSRHRFVWRDCIIPDIDNDLEDAELFFALSFFENTRTFAGRVSDGTYHYDATPSNGATFIDITTDLLWGGRPTANSTWSQTEVQIAGREHTSTNLLKFERAFLHKSGTAIQSVVDQRDPVVRIPLASAADGATPIQTSVTVRLRPPAN